jgi:hypothetical protein
MSDEINTGFEEQGVTCRRIGKRLPPDEHARCAYCHGDKAEIQTGEHGKFCNYDPNKDPVHFGFPPGAKRDERG